jgi:hypothetical protein
MGGLRTATAAFDNSVAGMGAVENKKSEVCHFYHFLGIHGCSCADIHALIFMCLIFI